MPGDKKSTVVRNRNVFKERGVVSVEKTHVTRFQRLGGRKTNKHRRKKKKKATKGGVFPAKLPRTNGGVSDHLYKWGRNTKPAPIKAT